VRAKVLRAAKEQIKAKFSFYVSLGGSLYSLEMVRDEFTVKAENDGVDYAVTINWAKNIDMMD